MSCKKGNILVIVLFVTAVIIILFVFIILFQYFQINVVLEDIKESLFYIGQNAVFSYDVSELSYGSYIVNKSELKKYILNILNLNHVNNKDKVESIDIEELSVLTKAESIYNHNKELMGDAILHIVINVKFKPIVNINKKIYSIKIHEDVKLCLMKH